MSGEAFDPEAVIDALAPMLGIVVAEADRKDVANHLAVAKRIAADVLAFELEDDAEPAPVYRP